METTNSDPQAAGQPPNPPVASSPLQPQQQAETSTTTTTQQLQSKAEPIGDEPLALQVQPTPPPPTITTQPIQVVQAAQPAAPQQEPQPIATTQQQPIQLSVQPTTTTAHEATSQPIQLQVQPIMTQATTTATPLQATPTVTATTAQLTPITTSQLPRGLPTIQIRPQGTTLTLTTPTVATTPPVVATNLSVTNQAQTAASQPTTTTPAIIKAEPYRFICCLLDNGVRCDKIAGNASFNLRIQKVVMTKKLNFELDPKVTHGYICEYHKGIITVAKKSTTIPRGDSKGNVRNHATVNNNNTALEATSGVAVAPTTNNIAYTTADLSRQPAHQRGPITTLQQPVNLKLITNTNQRLTNNHHPATVTVGTTLNTIPIVRQGAQIAYAHYQPTAAHQNQISNMDVIMSNSNYDNTGGDSLPDMGQSSSGIDVDLQQLQVNTLRRYKRHFRVQTRPGLNKMQLAESLKSHFRTLPIIEKEAITYFVYIVKCFRNKLDHNPKAD